MRNVLTGMAASTRFCRIDVCTAASALFQIHNPQACGGQVKNSRMVASKMPVVAWQPRPTASKTRVFIGNFGGRKPVNSTASTGFMERAMGIEPTSEAWEASILPLYDARSMFLIVLRN
jgi:hypothetical protein